MEHVPLLDELAVIACIAVVVTVVLARLKLPTVAGLLAAGALVGPNALKMVTEIHAIEVLAEVGVVLLLFTIGLEFSLAHLRNIFRQVAIGGGLQVGLTTAATAAVCVAIGEPFERGIFYGFIVALSSTAIVLRGLSERRELDAPHGKLIVGTLIFQDLCVVPMVLIVPMLGSGGGSALDVGLALGKAALLVAATIAIARFVVPLVLRFVDASRSREVFLLAIIGICIGTAWITSLAGLSLALGAFLAGMVVAGTEYGHRAMGDMLPLRDAFVSVFFVSLGMLFDVRVVLAEPLAVLVLLLAFTAGKGLLATLAAMSMRFPARAAWLAGVGLAQFGEFGFVLARLGQSKGVVEAGALDPLLNAGIASMFLTPLLLRAAPHITAGERLLAPLERLIGVRGIDEADENAKLSGHVVIVGFGVAGRFAASTLAACDVPFVVLELNADTVRSAKKQNLPLYYADATSEEALGHAHLAEARLLVLLMNDPQAAERVISTARRVAPNVPILMRTHYFSNRKRLVEMGASDVVAEEVESAIEVVARMLRSVDMPRNVIDERIRLFRAETRTSERRHTVPRKRVAEVSGLAELKIESVEIRDGSVAIGNSPLGLQLQTKTGALAVAVRRGEALDQELDPHSPFALGDVVYLVGSEDAIRAAVALFEEKRE